MASCPCCAEPLPPDAAPGQLCTLCVDAMDAGLDNENPGAYDNQEQPFSTHTPYTAKPFLIERPGGVTLIAIMCFVIAAFWGLEAVAAIGRYAIGRAEVDTALFVVLACVVGALWMLLVGNAFWYLTEWVRVITIVFSFGSLLLGGPESDWWKRVIDIVLILYLMNPKVRAVFSEAEQQDELVVVDRWFRKWRGNQSA